MSKGLKMLENLSDERLLGRVGELVDLERRTTANLVVHLAEVEARELHLRDGSPSLFDWCRTRWGFGEDKAYNYVKAVEWVRRWPEMGCMLADGRLHLSGVRVIGPHLGEANVSERLAEAAGKSKRELAELVAKWSPRADVPARVVRLPAPAGRSAGAPKRAERERPAGQPVGGGLKLEAPRAQRVVEPLSEARFKVQVTVGARVAAKLEEAMALVGHQVASGDYETLLEMALDSLLAARKKQRFGLGAKPRAKKTPVPAPPAEIEAETAEQPGAPTDRSRAIPVEVKRAVVERDGLRCTFEGPGGRCRETRRLQLHHDEAFARGGEHSVDNVRVLCQAHNLLIARQELGARFVARKIAEASSRDDGLPPRRDDLPPRHDLPPRGGSEGTEAP